ncbi:MAG TPA: protoporphyrinogen oxidase [Candidatus Sulfomarinibacteraceae bacterium]|nr:protoporphyrinogen oxidase [Candidatus Sulfomarinibacteraceae bacterium]
MSVRQPGARLRVAIVGGGITGLSAAYYLQEANRAQALDIEVTLLEKRDRWGGKIVTEEVATEGAQPFVIEGGPDSFITQKPWAYQLAQQLGMEDRFLPTNDDRRQVFVLNNGRPMPLPDGVMLIVPTRFTPFALSPLISPLGKVRMAMDLFIPARKDDGDETLAEFVTRRLGSEALDKIAEPLMSGIYNAEAEKQSLMATFPRFRTIEKRHGSLIRGMLAARSARAQRPKDGNGPPSIFVSFRRGMAELVQELESRLRADCRLGVAVQRIERNAGAYALALSDGRQLQADAIVLAVPSYVAANLVRPLSPTVATELDKIRYVSTGTITLAFRAEDVANLIEGFGLVIPRSEKRAINAVTLTTTKFDERAPQDHVLVRVFFGGSRSPQTLELDDASLLTVVRSELKQLLNVEATPLFHRIYRWRRANPQYDVGHLNRVAAIEAAMPEHVYVTGSPYRGIGIPDCVYQAEKTVQTLLQNKNVSLTHPVSSV